MKTLLITGGSRGIGAGIARQAAAEGYNIIINYLNSAQKAQALADELVKVTGVLTYKADVSRSDEVEDMFKAAKARFGRVTHLVNNAGISVSGLLDDVDMCQYDRLIDINLKGVINVTRVAMADMVAAKEGAIVNVSSVWGVTGASCEAVYSATKGGVITFTQSIARELGPSGVRVNAVCPGCIDTDMMAGYSAADKRALIDEISLGRLGTPQDVAQLTMFLLSDKASYITGQAITIDGGFI